MWVNLHFSHRSQIQYVNIAVLLLDNGSNVIRNSQHIKKSKIDYEKNFKPTIFSNQR